MAVLLARCVVFHGKITERIIFTACIVRERLTTMGVVEESTAIVLERRYANCVIAGACTVE